MVEMENLEEVARRVRTCTDCPLSGSRTNAVPGEGPENSEIMFIGEGPGYQEDQQGRPFVGPAGKFLEELLESIGYTRQEVYIANMVKCRPTSNRDPLPAEIAACSKYLDRQIELIRPKLVVTLGRFSMSKFIPNESISRAHGTPRNIGGLTVFPIMHPAAALHRQELRKSIEEDFHAIPALLKETAPEPVVELPAAPKPEQLSMF